ncbi:MAG: hypothetical protein HKN47_16520 [Pirellulaceae bacterium]|nr:hypothetical protein [Pirellulaceae bacterium]
MDKRNEVYLALDQGTHSSRTMLISTDGHSLAKFQIPVTLNRLDDDRAEQDADELLQSLRSGIEQAIATAKTNNWEIHSAGLATQRSSVVAWNRDSGEAISPVISWLDRRAWRDVQRIADRAALIRQRTGLPLTPHYGASKIRWLLTEFLPAQSVLPARIGIGPLASYLIANLVSATPYCVDHTNALRTQLMNLTTLDWDPTLIDWFEIPSQELPVCVPVQNDFGQLRDTSVSLRAVSGDQTAAMFSHGGFPESTGLVNLGTGGFLLMPCSPGCSIEPELLGGIAFSNSTTTQYLIEGTVNGCALALKWAAEKLNLKSDYQSQLNTWLTDDKSPPIFINTVGGLGSPWWKDGGDPFWCDLDGTILTYPEPAAAMIAVIESIVFLIDQNVRRIALHEQISELRVSGGVSRLDGLCQRLANVTTRRVSRPEESESTACGVAWLAAGRPTNWNADSQSTVFTPRVDDQLQQRRTAFAQQIQQLP